ncbi:hypothetical protein CULT_2040006 [[Clostridium] ultunense Esp]|uniref:Uncharacterized protein n=1 Tax=[Clostridium] ultunense Esp TaxID=1288971 RepID=M1YW81_9FIRM|nr:hypothetical protein CULT_2040006 [[Clostridium] ultunense Esp]SHD78363.1 conserved protein of unknown function [[Clostridium] ultunense Esp]
MGKGGIIIGFLYIIGEKTYFAHFYSGLMRIVPKKCIPTTRVKILEHIRNNDGNIIGRVGGVFLNSLNMGKKGMVEEFVLAIEEFKNENTNSLIMENLSLLNKDDVKLIEKRTGLKIINGIKVLTFFLPLVLKEICKGLNENLKEKEVLIIGEDEILTKQIIEALYKEVRFITLAGDYGDIIGDISEYIMEKTGLSIFYSKKVDKILTNYSIIINLKDNYYLNVNKLRQKAIIFDFSISKGIRNQANESRGTIIIEDFMFKIDYLDIKKNKFINVLIPSYFYEQFNRLEPKDFAGLSIGGEFYNIESFLDYQIRIKGKL